MSGSANDRREHDTAGSWAQTARDGATVAPPGYPDPGQLRDVIMVRRATIRKRERREVEDIRAGRLAIALQPERQTVAGLEQSHDHPGTGPLRALDLAFHQFDGRTASDRLGRCASVAASLRRRRGSPAAFALRRLLV